MSGPSSARRHSHSATGAVEDAHDHPAPAPAVPTSLMTVGAADHPAEADADAAADRALSRLDRLRPGGDGGHTGHDHLRRTAGGTGSAEIGYEGGDLAVDTDTRIRGLRGRGRPLPDPVRRQMEQAFETPLDRVRVHSGAESADLNQRVSARAFTVGQDIFLGGDQLTSGAAQDRHVLAHEIAHTLQGPEGVRRATAPDAPVIRRYRTEAGGKKGGTFVGIPAACHCHIDIGNPHFKVGKDDGSRINFGTDMSKKRMQLAYDTMLEEHASKPGFEDCKEYLEAQGCKKSEEPPVLGELRKMLIKWGGLADYEFSYYVEGGERESVQTGDELNTVITDYEAEIRASDELYSDFLKRGAFRSEHFKVLDEDEMDAEANDLYDTERSQTRAAAALAQRKKGGATKKKTPQKI